MNGELAIFGIAISVAAYQITVVICDYLRDKNNVKKGKEHE